MRPAKPDTRREYIERILAVLVHIQEHLGQDLSLDELARVARFSPYHFHRIFRGLVGESVKQHVKRLRLERAAVELKGTTRPVTEIAFDAGYEAHESFTRAFRSSFECSPSEFRASHSRAAHASAPTRVHFEPSGGPRHFEPLRTVNEMNVEIRELTPVRVAFLRHTGPYEQVGATWGRLCDWAGAECLFGPNVKYFGMAFDDPEVTPAEHLRYDACVTVDESVKPQGEIGVRDVDGGRYAVTLHEGPYQKLGETYAALMGGWFPESGYEPLAQPCLEFYLNDPDGTPPEELLTEIWVPVGAVKPTAGATGGTR